MPNTFKHLLFDWDGCLVDTLPTWHASIKEALANQNITVSDHDLITHIMPHLGKAKEYGVTDFDRLVTDVLSNNTQDIHQKPLHQNVSNTLKQLTQKNAQLAIISSASRNRIVDALNHHSVAPFFEVIVSRDDVTATKPHPESVYKALTTFNTDPRTALIIGDSAADINAGKAAGVKTAVYYPAKNEAYYTYDMVKSYQADYLFREFEEILDLV